MIMEHFSYMEGEDAYTKGIFGIIVCFKVHGDSDKQYETKFAFTYISATFSAAPCICPRTVPRRVFFTQPTRPRFDAVFCVCWKQMAQNKVNKLWQECLHADRSAKCFEPQQKLRARLGFRTKGL